MKEIPLGFTNQVALVSDEDFERVSQYRWYVAELHARNLYALRDNARPQLTEVPTAKVLMHRFIIDAQPGQVVDHVNGNTLDNRRENLRLVTASQNNMNKKKPRTGRVGKCSSRFKGVSWDRAHQRWFAKITVRGHQQYLGLYESEEAAARAYDRAAREHFGEYSRFNFDPHGQGVIPVAGIAAELKHDSPAQHMVELVCPACGKRFTRPPIYVRRVGKGGHKMYCSKSCRSTRSNWKDGTRSRAHKRQVPSVS